MQNKLIILRGPSGAGKSTVAHALRKHAKIETLIIEQDYYHHTLLNSKKDIHKVITDIMYANAQIALAAGYNVIMEGILRKEKYQSMFEELFANFKGEKYLYYFDVSFEETAKRHATREKSKAFTAEEMKEWYHMAQPLAAQDEQVISEDMSQEAIIQLITQQTQI